MANAGPGGGTATLGLDASSYINSLSRVVQANQSANQSITQLTAAIQQLNTTSAAANSGTNRLNAGLGSLNSTLNVLAGISAARSIASLGQSLAQATNDAAAFSRSIGLIQTITQDAGLSYGQWAAGVRAVSDELGSPLLETSAAAYNLLSNQVSTAADTFTTLSTATKLAMTTNASAADAVDALSSAINAYGYSAGSAEEIAAKLFTTVDLGRVRLNELTATAGRAYESGKALGVSFEEVNASLVAITQTGVRSNTALTLTGQLFNQLAKPSKDLQKLYDELGVSTGEAFIRTNGLATALQILQEKTRGSTAELKKLFPELRAGQAFQILTDQSQAFANALSQQETAVARFRGAVSTFQETPGFKLQRDWNQVSNELTTGLKSDMMSFALDVTQSLGGVKGAVSEILTGVAAVATGIGGWNAALIASQASAAGLVATLSAAAVPATVAAVTAAAATVVLRFEQEKEAAAELHDALLNFQTDAANKQLASIEAVTSKDVEATKAALNEKQRATLAFIADQRQALSKIGDGLSDVDSKLKDKLRNSVELVLSSAKDAVRDLDAQISKATNNVTAAQRGRRDAAMDRSEAIFQQRVAADRAETGGANEDFISQQRLSQLHRGMARAAKGGDLTTLDRLSQKYLDLTKQLASATNAFGGLRHSGGEQAISDAYAKVAAFSKQAEAANEKSAAALAKAKVSLTADVKGLEDAGKALFGFSAVDKHGESRFSSQEELQAELGKVKARYDAALAKVQANPNAGATFKSALHQQIADARIRDVQRDFAERSGSLKDVNGHLATVAKLNASGDQLAITLATIAKKVQAAAGDVTRHDRAEAEAKSKSYAALGTLMGEGEATGSLFEGMGANAAETAHIKMRSMIRSINESADQNDYGRTLREFDNLEGLLKGLPTYRQPVMTSGRRNDRGELLNPTPESALQYARSAMAARRRTAEETLESRRQYGQLDQAAPQALDSLTETLAKFRQSAASIDASKITEATEALSTLIERVGQSIQRVEAMSTGERAVREAAASQSHGGPAGHFATGGFVGESRGVDSIPAWLSPGEFVVNAQSAARFATRLTAINAGWDRPSGGSAGNGHTFNGGISINVQGGNTQTTVQEIGKELRRQIRRGTLSL